MPSQYDTRRTRKRPAEEEQVNGHHSQAQSKRTAASGTNGGSLLRRSQFQQGGSRQADDEVQEQANSDHQSLDGQQQESMQEDQDEQAESDDEDSATTFNLLPYLKLPVNSSTNEAAQKLGDETIKRKATEIARMAMACDYHGIPIRKDDIYKKILEKESRMVFAVIFNKAQKLLQHTFGMQMVEIRARGAENLELRKQASAVIAESSQGQQAASTSKTDSSSQPSSLSGSASKMWALKSSLPSRLLASLSQPREELEQQARLASGACDSAFALDWNGAGPNLGSMGLLYVILSLILLNGRSLADGQLRAYFKRLHLYPETNLPPSLGGDSVTTGGADPNMSTQSISQVGTQSRSKRLDGSTATLDLFLKNMIKQMYLERVKTDSASGVGSTSQSQAGASQRRNRSSMAVNDEDDPTSFEWRWGSRAEAEVSEKQIAKMVTEIFMDPVVEDDLFSAEVNGSSHQQQQYAQDSNTRKQRRTQLLANIEAVAGSQLV